MEKDTHWLKQSSLALSPSTSWHVCIQKNLSIKSGVSTIICLSKHGRWNCTNVMKSNMVTMAVEDAKTFTLVWGELSIKCNTIREDWLRSRQWFFESTHNTWSPQLLNFSWRVWKHCKYRQSCFSCFKEKIQPQLSKSYQQVALSSITFACKLWTRKQTPLIWWGWLSSTWSDAEHTDLQLQQQTIL